MRFHVVPALGSFIFGSLVFFTWQFIPPHQQTALLPQTSGNNDALIAEAEPPPQILQSFTAINERTEALKHLSLKEKIGQMFMVGHWHQNDFYHTSNMMRAYHFGGVIIMEVSPRNVDFVPVWIQRWQSDSTILPALIAIDQEGGEVTRLRGPSFSQTAQRDLQSVAEAAALGDTRGAELSALGINVNLAPVLDTSLNPDSFLYARAFSSTQISTDFADAIITSQAKHMVKSAIKHYPGHPDTPEDSHIELPIIDIEKADFAHFTKPFSDVVARTNPPIIMTAHVLVPSIDPDYPATLSTKILTGELRDTLGYDGVIMTDDMTMGAITNQWGSAEAAVKAIQAGADIILFAAKPNESIAAVDAVLDAIAAGEISEERINQSVERIVKLKADFTRETN